MKNFLKKIMIGVWFCSTSVFAVPSIWDGSVDDSWYWNDRDSKTYTLTRASQLAGLAKLVNGNVFSFKGRTINLGADIFLNDTIGIGAGTWGDNPHQNWKPIGTKDSPFKGVLDGNAETGRHRIYGLYVKSSSDYAGLFGKTDSAKIINLDIPVGKITSKEYVGTLIGYGYDTEISNVRVETEINGSNYVGGLVGGTFGGIIIDSYFEGNVTGADHVGGLAGGSPKIISSHSSGTITGGNCVGGLAGSGGSVTDSYFKGDVSGVDYVGGLAGKGNVTNSYSEGNVTGANYVGGLGGTSNITGSYFKGDVSGVDYVGGLAGKGNVSNSHSEGSVTGANYIGGLAGSTYYAEGLYNSYFQGKVVASGNFAGGLVGLNVHYTISGEFFLENLYAIADVEGFDYVGGLIGRDSVGEKNYSDKIRISNCYSQGNVRGNSHVGGIIGRYGSNGDRKSDYEFNIIACHHSGSVFGKSDYVGGIIGRNDACRGSIDSSFHDGGAVSGKRYVGGLAGRIENIGLLKNSYSKGNITGSGSVGGLVGYAENIGLMNNSYSEGNITGSASYVGGICGFSVGDSAGYIYHTNGNVNGNNYVGGLFGSGKFKSVIHSYHVDGNVGGSEFVGGLAGYIYMGTTDDESKKGMLKNSYSVGDIQGKGRYSGGIIGYLSSGHIDSSYCVGNVYSEGEYTGGLVGYCYGNVNGESVEVLEIRNSYVIGDYVKGKDYVGGVAGGLNTCSIYSSYYDGDSVVGVSAVGGFVGVSSEDVFDSYSTADVLGKNFVGGLVGRNFGSVKNSYALGDVSGTKGIGGLVGYSSGGVSESWANGDVFGGAEVGGLVGELHGWITDSYANGNVAGTSRVGGFVGSAHGDRISRYIERNYASGTVSFSNEEGTAFGCLIGYIYADKGVHWYLDKSYYDKDKCNFGAYGEFNGTGFLSDKSQAKTTAEMQIQSTFEQWNFTDIWAISDNSYPYHRKFANFLFNADVVTDSLSGFMYDGLPKMPKVKSVILFGNELTEDVDYTIEYKNNLNAGIARIKICGENAYSGCKIVKFEIAAIPIEIIVDPVLNVVYTGEMQTPKVKVYNGESLMEDEGYSVEYKNNINAGTASVIVTLKGNYSGTASTTFIIEKATPVISQNPMANDVLIGEALASSDLSGGISNVEGLFAWKTPETIPTLENEGYAVEFIPTDADNYNSVEIVVPIKVWDVAYVVVHLGDMTLDSAVVIKGNTYTLPTVFDSVGCNFVGFYNGNLKVGDSGDEIVVNENTNIDAVYEIKTFVVKFVNGDTELQSEELAYGTLPKYKGEFPKKNATVQWTYSFKGWNPGLSSVTESVTYTAVFDSVVNKYDISFKDYDGSVLKGSIQYDYGTSSINIVKPTSPARQETAKYTYSFKGWNPTITDVIENAVYIAEYDSSIRDYQIVFVNGNDELQSETVLYEDVPTYNGALPVKSATNQYTYTFKGWNPAISSVVGSVTYTAVFDSIVNKYEVVFKDYDGSNLKKTALYDYGTSSTNIVKPANPTRHESVKYTYSFKGWAPTLEDVTENAVYIAEYDSTIRRYTISFVNGSKEIQSSKIAYGTTPSYKGELPTKKATAQYAYTFKGWSPSIASVSGNATYKAVFDSTVKEYAVSFINDDKILQTSSVAYGEIPKYTGKTPTRTSTKSYSYEFVGWSPKVEAIVGEITYKAVFDSTNLTGMMNNRLANLNISVSTVSRNIQISAAPLGVVYAIFDMQGRVLKKGRVESPNFNIMILHAGTYFVRIGSYVQRINIK